MIPNDETLPAKIIPQTNWHHHCKGYDTSKWRRQNFFDLTTDASSPTLWRLPPFSLNIVHHT